MSDSEITGRNFPFMHFGRRLWNVREKRGLRSKDVAAQIGIQHREYQRFEYGESLPSPDVMIAISRLLKIEISRLKDWCTYARRAVDEIVSEGALKYEAEFDQAIQAIKNSYTRDFGHQLTDNILKIFPTLKKDVSRLHSLPILPMNLLLILDGIDNKEREVQFLHEIGDFVVDKESLAGYVSREPYLACFIHFAANRCFFQGSASKGLRDTFNRLTLRQFQDLLYIALGKSSLYANDDELPYLQQQMEFCSLGGLMVRELETHLGPTHFDELYFSVLAQGLGEYALYTVLQPSIKGRGEMAIADRPGSYAGLNDDLMHLIVRELHPIVAAMIAANWQLPESVIHTLIHHHDQPVKDVTPLCAWLKLINFFTDCDFPKLNREDLTQFLEQYPQIEISVETLFQITVKLSRDKEKLIEMSSTIIQASSSEVASMTQKKFETKMMRWRAQNAESILESRAKAMPRKSDLRFDPECQKALLNEAFTRIDYFKTKHVTPRKGESLDAFGRRIQNLYLRLDYTSNHDTKSLAAKYLTTEDDVKARLLS